MKDIIKVLCLLIFVLSVFSCGKKDDSEKRIRTEKEVAGTVWMNEILNDENEKTVKLLHFRDGMRVTLKNVNTGEIWLWDYDYKNEGGEGYIYLYDKKDVMAVLESYKINDVLEWEYRIMEKFERKDDRIEYLGYGYKKVDAKKIIMIDKDYR